MILFCFRPVLIKDSEEYCRRRLLTKDREDSDQQMVNVAQSNKANQNRKLLLKAWYRHGCQWWELQMAFIPIGKPGRYANAWAAGRGCSADFPGRWAG
jgi:hypothetical protein